MARTADLAYLRHRAEREAIAAIQATTKAAAAVHQDLCRRYSALVVGSLARR